MKDFQRAIVIAILPTIAGFINIINFTTIFNLNAYRMIYDDIMLNISNNSNNRRILFR